MHSRDSHRFTIAAYSAFSRSFSFSKICRANHGPRERSRRLYGTGSNMLPVYAWWSVRLCGSMHGRLSTARSHGVTSGASPPAPPQSPGWKSETLASQLRRHEDLPVGSGSKMRSRPHRCCWEPPIFVRSSISYAAVREPLSGSARLRKIVQGATRPLWIWIIQFANTGLNNLTKLYKCYCALACSCVSLSFVFFV